MNEKRLSIRLNELLDTALRKLGEETNLSLNALANLAIREYIDKWNRNRERDKDSTQDH